MNSDISKSLEEDIAIISRIDVVPTLLDVVCKTTGMGFAAIARVTEEKWVTCSVKDDIAFGLVPGSELVLETTICHEIRQHKQPVIIDHVAEDKHYKQHHTPLQYGFQSYISMPIIKKDGTLFGTLCAIDPQPAKLNNPETIGMFKLFTDLISFHIQVQEELQATEAKLVEAKRLAEVREQFIAILGHDLKNPLTAVMTGSEMLLQFPLDENGLRVVKTIKNSSYRMALLVENILDFARGNLGGGITLNKQEITKPAETLNQVITELSTIWPDRIVETDFQLDAPIVGDVNRLAQLFSNLIGNAFIHGSPGTPVTIRASSNGTFNLSITNHGTPIPPALLGRLFQPYYRGEDVSGKSGLGLGLYIANEIAKAHGGKLTVVSNEAATSFQLSIPSLALEDAGHS